MVGFSKYVGSVRTQLILLKTEKRTHCSKIFFKCLNSAVGPVFHIFLNNVVAGPVYGALFLLYNESMSMNSAVTVHMREKKNGNAKLKTQMHNKPNSNGLVLMLIFLMEVVV